MIVLGLNAFGNNPSACLVVDGKLTAFCQEERLNRLKGSRGMFPSRAVEWCLRSRGFSLADLDRISLSWDCGKYPWTMLRKLVRSRFSPSVSGEIKGPGSCKGLAVPLLEYCLTFTPDVVQKKTRDSLRAAGLNGPMPRLEFVPHHLSHAWQAYWQSPFGDAAVLVADGSGEENCISAFEVRSGVFRKLFGVDVPDSLGWFYGGFTAYLGFRADRDEGKLMGLAALGESRRSENPWPERLEKILRINPGGFEMDPGYFKLGAHNLHPRFSDTLAAFMTSFDPELKPVRLGETARFNGIPDHRYLAPGYVDLAWAVQDRLEQAVLVLARRLLDESGLGDLCLAGGVFMNCKANGMLVERSGARNIFVHPAGSDDGSCIGAALHTAANGGDNPRNVLDNVQFGPSFTETEIMQALQVCGIDYSRPPDICRAVASLVARGRVVGWFQGKLEMGARALGGRSIVATPVDPTMKERINRQVKFREQWRPYCPSLLRESASGLLKGGGDYPYMIVARDAGATLSEQAPAVVHVDSTVRPQTVDRQSLPLWHSLIECVGEKTGLPVVLNTSLNVRGEPVACSPRDALACLYTTGLDALAIGNFLIVKRGNRR